jgi:DNA-binding CsgD family transcriptional regulator
MRPHSNPQVDWSLWWGSRQRDVRHPEKMFSSVGRDGRAVCQLCQASVAAWQRADHHLAHMVELDAWLADAERQAVGQPKPDSVRRSEDRRARRQQQLEQAAAFDRDPFLYAVEGVEPLTRNPMDRRVRPVVRRRQRHPKAETLARVHALLAEGRLPSVIAGELKITEKYVRRLIRQIEGSGGLK